MPGVVRAGDTACAGRARNPEEVHVEADLMAAVLTQPLIPRLAPVACPAQLALMPGDADTLLDEPDSHVSAFLGRGNILYFNKHFITYCIGDFTCKR